RSAFFFSRKGNNRIDLLFQFRLLLEQSEVVCGAVGPHLGTDKTCLDIVVQELLQGLAIFSYMAKKNSGSIRIIMPRVARVLPPRSEERRVGKECGSGWARVEGEEQC